MNSARKGFHCDAVIRPPCFVYALFHSFFFTVICKPVKYIVSSDYCVATSLWDKRAIFIVFTANSASIWQLFKVAITSVIQVNDVAGKALLSVF